MAPPAWIGTRRALVIYLGAVVGPTLLVLGAGGLAVRRQAAALDTLRVTTRSLQEARIAEEVERQALARAEAALRDSRLAAITTLPDDAPPEDLDRARADLRGYHLAHPIVQDVVVMQEHQVMYPRLEPPLPARTDTWVLSERAAARAALAQHITQAATEERIGALAEAAGTYMEAAALASTARVAAWLLSSAARCEVLRGDQVRAIALYRRLVDQHAATYTPAGRPHAVSAAIELRRLGALDPARERRIADGVSRGTWTMSASQVRYALAELGAASDAGVHEALARLMRAGRVRDELLAARAAAPGNVGLRSIAGNGVTFDVAHMRLAPPLSRRVAVILDSGWLHGTLVPAVAARLAPDVRVRTGTDVAPTSPGFRTIQTGWRVAIEPASGARAWIRADLLAFVSAVVVVLGVLVMGVVLLMRDVTRETALNQMRADLVSGVSHELKAPISVIRAYAETLEAAADATPTQRLEFTKAIVEETDRLRRLVDDVVDFSRIQQGQRIYRMGPASLTSAVERAVERFGRYADLHGFQLTAEVSHGEDVMHLDADAVEQAILNLLDNAVKYGGDDKRIDVRLRSEATTAVVEVRDQGPGVPAEDLARIFERFHRGPQVDRGGYGLGLYLVRHVMEAHGGTVAVDSAPGRGAVFSLRFPRQEGHGAHSAG